MLLVGKVIGRFKKRVYYIALLSHVNNDEFKKMRLFGVRRFSVEKETYLITIYNSSRPCHDIIQGDSSLYGNDQVVAYGLDYAINNYSNSEDMEKIFII